MKEFEILKEQHARAQALTYNDHDTLDDIVRKGTMALENLMPIKMYSYEIKHIKFSNLYIGSTPKSTYKNDWDKGKNELINLLDTAIQDYDIQSKKPKPEPRVIIRERIVQVKDETAINELKGEFGIYKLGVKNWSLFILFTIVASVLIWLFFTNSDWHWYNSHNKKLSITLLLNLTVIVGLLNLPLKTKWLVWIPIVFAALTTIFTLI